ncbi:MAG: LysO family transporter [Desulfocucumaceae bacterium]
MVLILLSLVGGIIIGFIFPPKETGLKIIQRMTLAGLFLLLAVMGAQLGGNEKVLANLDKIGFQALVLSSLAVLGSVLAVYVFFGWLHSPQGGKRDKGCGE